MQQINVAIFVPCSVIILSDFSCKSTKKYDRLYRQKLVFFLV
nr:MAG TPA: hypothetical protein [Caudoviricetes sp.]